MRPQLCFDIHESVVLPGDLVLPCGLILEVRDQHGLGLVIGLDHSTEPPGAMVMWMGPRPTKRFETLKSWMMQKIDVHLRKKKPRRRRTVRGQ